MSKHLYSYFCSAAAAIITFLFITTSCNKNINDPSRDCIKGSLVSSSCCKIPGKNYYSDNFHSSDEGMDYYYDDSEILLLTHVNAAFNMCPGEFTSNFSVSGDSIIIDVLEVVEGCQRTSLYDLEYRLENVPLGKYIFKITTPYTKQIEPFVFTIDLNITREGSFNIRRNFYPWETL